MKWLGILVARGADVNAMDYDKRTSSPPHTRHPLLCVALLCCALICSSSLVVPLPVPVCLSVWLCVGGYQSVDKQRNSRSRHHTQHAKTPRNTPKNTLQELLLCAKRVAGPVAAAHLHPRAGRFAGEL